MAAGVSLLGNTAPKWELAAGNQRFNKPLKLVEPAVRAAVAEINQGKF
jgi:hypothetical protein